MRHLLLALALLGGVNAFAAAQTARRDDPVREADIETRAVELGMDLRDDDRVALLRERPRGGALSRMRGAVTTEGRDVRERARDFVERHGGAFGYAPILETAEARALDPEGRRVWVAQTVHGHELAGHGLHLRFDDQGRVVLAHGAFSGLALAARPAAVSAVDAVVDGLRAAGIDPDELDAPATSRPTARVSGGAVQLLHEVGAIVDRRPLRLDVDAQSGALLRVREDVVHGTGTFRFGETDIAFDTRNGKGGVFKNAKAAMQVKGGLGKLPQLSADEINVLFAPLGSLTGRYVQVLGASGLQILSTDYLFAFDPTSQNLVNGFFVEAELFDHVNTYQWLTRMGAFMEKLLGDAFPVDYSVPAFVNYDDEGAGYLNAFYSPADSDGPGPYAPGYLLFGEFSGITGDPMDDFSRDPSIVCHEYTHMLVDKAGGSFGDAELDTPSRAFNEALADYAAAAFLKDPALGEVLLHHGGEVDWGVVGPALRDLRSELTLPDDLWDVVGAETDLPQEHTAGNILGAALWRARKSMKSKAADQLVFLNLLDLPQSTAETGHAEVTPANATEAWEAYAHGIFAALFDELLLSGGKQAHKLAGALTGAFMSHGVVGVDPDNVAEFDATEGGLKLIVDGAFLGSLDTHYLDLRLAAGQTLSLAIKGRKGTLVDFALDADPGDGDSPGEITATKPKKVNKKGTKAAQAKLAVELTRSYRLTLTNPEGAGGDYRLVVKVK